MLQFLIGIGFGVYFAEQIREAAPILDPNKGGADEVSTLG